jgi:hypothetical protein
MKYLLLTHLDEAAWTARTEAERQRLMGQVSPHLDQLIANGKFLEGAPLNPTSEAVTVRLRGGRPVVTDGPFAETREQVGGYTLIDAQDRDEAISIAKGFLGPEGPAIIEVRQVAPLPFPLKNS